MKSDSNNSTNADVFNLIKLKDKLLDLRANSPKIKFYLRKGLSYDLCELENSTKFSSEFISNLDLLLKEEKEFSLDFTLLRSLEPEEKEKIMKRIKELQRNSQRIQLEKGVNGLFLSLFFLRGYFFGKYVINAPLFFFAAKFQKNGNVAIEKSKRINYTLLHFLKKMFNLENDPLQKCKEKLENDSKTDLKGLFFCAKQALQELLQNHVSIKDSNPIDINTFSNFSDKQLISLDNPSPDEPKLEPFFNLKLSDRSSEFKENELEISFNAILTINRGTNLSLFSDFEKIIEKCMTNELQNVPSSGIDLLINKNENDYANDVTSAINSHDKTLQKLYTPFDSDPSQSRILKKIINEFHGNVLCIDGPPGTGKTQLICNLIANCLIYNQKVAIVCEKDVALKVIYDKLNQIGIKNSAIKINELEQTPSIYRHILEIEEIARKNKLQNHISQEYENKITSLEEKNSSYLAKLENYHKIQKEFHNKHGVLLGEVYIKANRTERVSGVIDLIKWVSNKTQLDKLKLDLEEYVNKLKQIIQNQKEIFLDLKHLFLSYNKFKTTFNPLNENYLKDIITILLKELKGENNSKFLSKFFRIKLVKENNKNPAILHLLEKKNNEITFLSQRQDLKTLFLFLDIKSLDEFWQKCVQKAFLLNLQKFIEDNFLAIANLSSLISNFGEKTQMTAKFLLEKVFNSQEFDWLENYPKIVEQAVYINWLNASEEEKPILYHWSFSELTKIHLGIKQNNEEKKKITQEILKIKQQINHQHLLDKNVLIQSIKKKRGIPRLRSIFPDLLDCFPIWLMIPEVMSSAVKFDKPFFDLLIFDESSQITLESSIPLLVRAKKCLVIGDEKQLPPTNFFNLLLDEDEELFEDEEEEEKIIGQESKKINLQGDDLRSSSSLINWAKKYTTSRQKETLLYHYRSKYPELIEFSNQAFYHGNLQVIRDTKDKESRFPVEFIKVKGSWINNKNEVEALFIINELLEKKLSGTDKKIGIITFNRKQRELLESYDEIIEKWKGKNDLFIKNLEEVQGDERDIIIFSVGYAQNEEGKFFHFFGPLNKEGGENRLNVAISRAKEKIIVVSSLLPSEFNVSNSKNIGPKLLKEYLEYALACQNKDWEKQQQILAKKIPKIINISYTEDKALNKFDSPFEEEVYKELAKLGWEIETQVGSFGYKIDLAIRSSQNNQYILGIECDGWTYHHQLEDIERDEYRQNILESKGWNIIRICSRDWWGDNNKKMTISWIKEEVKRISERQ